MLRKTDVSYLELVGTTDLMIQMKETLDPQLQRYKPVMYESTPFSAIKVTSSQVAMALLNECNSQLYRFGFVFSTLNPPQSKVETQNEVQCAALLAVPLNTMLCDRRLLAHLLKCTSDDKQ